MKPENVMLDNEGHCKLIDFGLARDDIRTEEPVNMTFCGTKEYMAPEVFARQPYNKAADWWSLGAVGYDMIAGEFPYQPGDYETPIRYNPSVFSNLAASFISKLLMKNAKQRLGSPHLGGATSIKRSSFFRGLNWNVFYRRGKGPGAIRPPFVPRLDSKADVKYFDKDFVTQPPVLSVAEADAALPTTDNMFAGFDYVHPSSAMT